MEDRGTKRLGCETARPERRGGGGASLTVSGAARSPSSAGISLLRREVTSCCSFWAEAMVEAMTSSMEAQPFGRPAAGGSLAPASARKYWAMLRKGAAASSCSSKSSAEESERGKPVRIRAYAGEHSSAGALRVAHRHQIRTATTPPRPWRGTATRKCSGEKQWTRSCNIP